MANTFIPRQYIGIEQERTGNSGYISINAPDKGLNLTDNESSMDSNYALEMINFFPEQGSVKSRKGYQIYQDGLTGNIETLFEYKSGINNKFLCANNGQINDISIRDNVINLANSLINNRWQWVNFNNYLLMVNGVDNPKKYDGINITDNDITGENLDVTKLDGINIFKNRLYLWDSETSDFWYSDINAISGTFNKFPLSRVCPSGGNLVAMEVWNLDGGDGVDDLALFLMDSGDVALYQGSNPSNVNDWSLVGLYKIGSPISKRGIKKIAGDVIIMTDQEFVFFSEVFKNTGIRKKASNISQGAVDSVERYKSNYGFEAFIYPKGNWLLFNIPVVTNNEYKQYVMNMITGAFAEFNNINARCFGLYNGNLYFGEDGKVMQADINYDDNGDDIYVKIKTAFSNLTTPLDKTLNSYRNIFKFGSNCNLESSVIFDYGKNSTNQTTNITNSSGSLWGNSLWGVARWQEGNKIRDNLIIASGNGTDFSMQIEANIKDSQLSWYKTDYNININSI